MSEQKTAIELLADAVRSGDQENLELGDVLVPEQCMELFTAEGRYSVSIEKCDDGPDEDDTLRERPQPVEPPHADMARELDAVVNKYDLSALRDAVAKLEQRYRDEIASYHDDHAYETFDALSNDFSDRTVSLLHAEGLEDLFDMIEPWLMGGSLTLEQKVKVVRALKDAKPVSEGMDSSAITDIIDLGDNAPTFYIQLC